MLGNEREAGNLSPDGHGVIIELLNKAMLQAFGKNANAIEANLSEAEANSSRVETERDEPQRKLVAMQTQIAVLMVAQKG